MISPESISLFLAEHYGLVAHAEPLAGEVDSNFLLHGENGSRWVLKIAPRGADTNLLMAQLLALQHCAAKAFPFVPQPVAARNGALLVDFPDPQGPRPARMLTYLPGTPLAHHRPASAWLLRHIGAFLARLDQALADFDHPALHRSGFLWDIRRAALVIHERLAYLPPALQAIVETIAERFTRYVAPWLEALPHQIIHQDANDYNLLVHNGNFTGLVDFGDMLHGPRVAEVAVAAAYALLDETHPLDKAAEVVAGYHTWTPLTAEELALLDDLIRARLAMSAAIAAERRHTQPDNPYLQISARPVHRALHALAEISHTAAQERLLRDCVLPGPRVHPVPHLRYPALLQKRRTLLGRNLSLHYRRPIHMVRAFGQYMYDAEGRAYLDCVNNVPHVGHNHPRVVAALARQATLLNTNTRYLYEPIVELAERLSAKLPDRLRVWFFVNSGSEANDLALRLAWTYTGQKDVLVLEGAYHGNLSSLIAISPYKFDGPGGQGAPPWVHKLPMPCAYRGIYRNEPNPARAYGDHARQVIARVQEQGRGIAAFIAEAMMGTGGQVVFPPGTLQEIYQAVREAGGVCIADEVQIGFGRVGTHFWGFETQGVVPDIVTFGKPMGNGHPLAAVVTTPEIAEAFHTGMEYFNTFGGNPVSCAVGLAVLDVLDEEGLQEHARVVGDHLKSLLWEIAKLHPLIGDVRGSGLFLGVELVRDPDTLEPAAEEAHALVEFARTRGVLLGVDGPFHNVLKIKPPLPFTQADAERLAEVIHAGLTSIEAKSLCRPRHEP